MIEKTAIRPSATILKFPDMARKPKIQNFPNRLRELRKARGLTLQKVADMTGIAFTNIGKMETGERDLKSWHMEKFAEAYGVCQADLFNPEAGGLTPEERALIDTYRDIPSAMRKSFDALADSHQQFRGASEIVPFRTSKDEEDRDGERRSA